MLISELVEKLEKVKSKEGDVPVFIWDEVYMNEFELEDKFFTVKKNESNRKGIYPKRVRLG